MKAKAAAFLHKAFRINGQQFSEETEAQLNLTPHKANAYPKREGTGRIEMHTRAVVSVRLSSHCTTRNT